MSFFDRIKQTFSPVGIAAYGFRKQRFRFYENLADRMDASAGKRTTLDLFLADKDRFGTRTRGKLSAYWAERFKDSGGDLAAAWEGTLPDEEVMLIRVAQSSGEGAIQSALRDISRVGQIIEQAKSEFLATISMALFGLLVAAATLAAIPLFSVPALKSSFDIVSTTEWGPIGQRLLFLESFLSTWGIPILAAFLGLIIWCGWSLPRWIGPQRDWCDKHIFLYKLYRDFKGALFMATLASMTKARGGASTILIRSALEMLEQSSTPWLAWHIRRILHRINTTGRVTAAAFDTGVLEEDTLYLFMEVYETRGFDIGMQKAGETTEKNAVKQIASRAVIIRWGCLMLGLGVVMFVALQHVGFVYEIKGVMMSSVISR